MFNYKVGQFLREQSREQLDDGASYGVNKAEKVQTRSLSYLEKAINKAGQRSFVDFDDIP